MYALTLGPWALHNAWDTAPGLGDKAGRGMPDPPPHLPAHQRLNRLTKFYRLAWLAGWLAASAQAAPSAEDVLAALGVTEEQKAQLERGEIVTHADRESDERELAANAALFVPMPAATVFSRWRQAEASATDADNTAQGEMPAAAGLEAFAQFAYTPDQDAEVDGLLDAEPGGRFNLSPTEADGFRQLRKQLAEADAQTKALAVSRRYRELLLGRWQAYRRLGLAGLPPYGHTGRGAAEPTHSLRTAAENDPVLARFYPALRKAWLDYPSARPPDVSEQYFWLNRSVEGRPTAILGHRLLQATGEGGLAVVRHYYVGHSYNSVNLIVGCLPYRGGAVVFYAQRTSTEQVAGLAGGLRHAIGRELMKQQMVGRLEALRSLVGLNGADVN